ncbi:hypothetical protein DXG01_014476 [Tephrocybe rancida]|nr:hypothetical protein DXG01_014476 [Tephrocybe rancida]
MVTLFEQFCIVSEALKGFLSGHEGKNNILYTAFARCLLEFKVLYPLYALPEKNLFTHIRLLERVVLERLTTPGREDSEAALQLNTLISDLKFLTSVDDVLIRLQTSQGLDSSATWRNLSGSDLEKREQRRQHLIFEFISGERDFLTDITFLIKQYKNPLCDPVLDLISNWRRTEVCSDLFLNIEALQQSSKNLLSQLMDLQTIHHPVIPTIMPALTSTFVTQKDAGDAFYFYTTSYPQARYVADMECSINPKFRALLERPVFRFLQYILLLKEMLAITPEGHPDRREGAAVLRSLRSIADAASKGIEPVNDHINYRREASKIIYDCQSLEPLGYRGFPLDPGGKVVNSSQVTWGNKSFKLLVTESQGYICQPLPVLDKSRDVLIHKAIAITGIKKLTSAAPSLLLAYRGFIVSFKTLDAAGKPEQITLSCTKADIQDQLCTDLALAHSHCTSVPHHIAATLALMSYSSSPPNATLPILYKNNRILAIGSVEGLVLGRYRETVGQDLAFNFFSVIKSLGELTQLAVLSSTPSHLLLLSKDKSLSVFPISSFVTTDERGPSDLVAVAGSSAIAPDNPQTAPRMATGVDFFVLGRLLGVDVVVVVTRNQSQNTGLTIEIFKVSCVLMAVESAERPVAKPMARLLLPRGTAIVGNAIALHENLLVVLTVSGSILSIVHVQCSSGYAI